MATKRKKKAKPPVLTAERTQEIREYIEKRRSEKVEDKVIRKEVFKRFGIDTEQWELNWAPNATKLKGTDHNKPVAEGQELSTTHQLVKRHEEVNFQHRYSDAEINEMGKQLSQLEIDRDGIEGNKKVVMDDFNTRIKEKEKQILDLSRKINSGFEMKNETCEVVRNFDDNTKKSYYKNVLVKEEKIPASEYSLIRFPEEETA